MLIHMFISIKSGSATPGPSSVAGSRRRGTWPSSTRPGEFTRHIHNIDMHKVPNLPSIFNAQLYLSTFIFWMRRYLDSLQKRLVLWYQKFKDVYKAAIARSVKHALTRPVGGTDYVAENERIRNALVEAA
jgi:hypothetical protein